MKILKKPRNIFFLDDERSINDVTWIDYKLDRDYVLEFKTSHRLIGYIKRYGKHFDWENILFSLDHDLQEFEGDEEYTGYTFIKWLVDYFIENDLSFDVMNFVVHSKNPIGKENIEAYVRNAKLYRF